MYREVASRASCELLTLGGTDNSLSVLAEGQSEGLVPAFHAVRFANFSAAPRDLEAQWPPARTVDSCDVFGTPTSELSVPP
jgi:hypothetical protein